LNRCARWPTSEHLIRSFAQRSPDRSGVGLGLSICLKAAKANAVCRQGLRLHPSPEEGATTLSIVDGGKSRAARMAEVQSGTRLPKARAITVFGDSAPVSNESGVGGCRHSCRSVLPHSAKRVESALSIGACL
jgi:hypothetical protein